MYRPMRPTRPADRVNINQEIRVSQVRAIDPDGTQLGVITIEQALAAAAEFGQDLVEVSPNADPPVCKIMDYGKFKYQQNKRSQEAKKKASVIQVKEVKIRPKTDDHDLEFKIRHIRRFLGQKDKAKVTMLFRGREIVYADLGMKILGGGDWDIYWQPSDGSRPADVLLRRPYDQFPDSMARDGTLLYFEMNPKTGLDLWTLSPDGRTSPLRVTPFNEKEGRFSPVSEGAPRWVANSSDESGRFEVYVQSYPAGTNRIAVSDGGGSTPMWSADGKELFYLTGDAVVAVAVRSDGTIGAPRRLFDRSNYYLRYGYDVSPDGQRFLMIRRDEGSVQGAERGEAEPGPLARRVHSVQT